MTKPAILLTFIITAFVSMPAHAQQRVFVSGLGFDTNPCTVTQPCRTFQQAYNTVPANGEIDVLDPAGYGPLTITHGISIQGHGWASITQTSSNICVPPSPSPSRHRTRSHSTAWSSTAGVMALNGINITSGPSVTIFNSVVRHLQYRHLG